ncbi:MAG: DUF1673 family protein, partial [Methanoregula sp.]|nr:DUF1673 family protein [Methanoregula sp.]
MHIARTIRKYLGWCPNTESRIRTAAVLPCDEPPTPSGSGSFVDRAVEWLGLFQNQMLVLSIWFSVAGCLLLVTIGDANVNMFFWGIIAGLALSAFLGYRFWRVMDEVRENGAVFLASLYDKTTIFLMVLAFSIPMVISFGVNPGANLMTWNAIISGYIFIIFWVQFLVVSCQLCNVAKNLMYYFHTPHEGVEYDEIHRNTFRRRTQKTKRTHCQ